MRFWSFSLRTKMDSTILIKYGKNCWSVITVVSLNFLVFNLLLARITLINTIFNNLGLWKLSVFLPKSNGGQTTWFSFEIVFGVCYSNNAFVRTQWFKKLLVEICHFNTKNINHDQEGSCLCYSWIMNSCYRGDITNAVRNGLC